ncbi:hypothetical protein J4226_01865 [Candidatus Pacearchaeota archaeon]|nr:hypothetical protein [Candidatus Pacearchaeota archaeon]
MAKIPQGKKTLVPRTKVNSEGKIAYSESFQAWNTLKLKKELFSEFPQLKEKRSKFSYELVYYRDSKEFEKAVREMVKGEGGAMPLLLWIFKEE